MKSDLLIVIRCAGEDIGFVIDTYQAVQYYTSDSTEVVFAVDGGNEKFAKKLVDLFGEKKIYVAMRHWGWGAGLYSLLVESYLHFRNIYEFNHLQSIDYDTLYIGEGADKMLLDKINSDKIGLLGAYRSHNEHWKMQINKEKEKFGRTFGKIPLTCFSGEGIQGGWMTLARVLLDKMEKRKMFEPPFSVAKDYTGIADDHLLPIFVRMCGLEIVDASNFVCCNWKAREDPRGLEKKGVKVFHPTKLVPHNKNKSTEIEIRNYFRRIRKCPDLLKL